MSSPQPSPEPSTPPAPSDPSNSSDPTDHLHWSGLRALLAAMDEDIAAVYRERGLADLRPRFTKPLIKLAHRGPMTIRALAEAIEGTHSATSQTVAAMRTAGYVRTVPGADARTREVVLTPKARELIPFLETEWRATEAAVAELDAAVPYPMTRVVADLQRLLAEHSFADRVTAHFGQPLGEASTGLRGVEPGPRKDAPGPREDEPTPPGRGTPS